MSDLIDRQNAIDVLEILADKMSDAGQTVMAQAVAVLKDLLPAEPERKKGKWIDGKPYVNSHWRVCSVCHESAPESSGGYNFCPHCGAEMRGEHE